jgi:hypothetical protein
MGCRDYPSRKQKHQFPRSVTALMMSQVRERYITLALLFTFCQVIGAMCAVPDLSERHATAILIEDRITCSMNESAMCPPSLTSSPERQTKPILFADADHSPVLNNAAASVLTVRSAPQPRSGSNALSIVPISIESSSVLRI